MFIRHKFSFAVPMVSIVLLSAPLFPDSRILTDGHQMALRIHAPQVLSTQITATKAIPLAMQPVLAPPPERANLDRLQILLPTLTLRDVNGKELRLDSLRGHPILLDLWATWCVPCRDAMPFIAHIFTLTHPLGLSVIGLDEDEKAETAVRFMERNGYNWPDYHENPRSLMLPHDPLPLVLLIDQKGNLVYTQAGEGDNVGLVEALKRLDPRFVTVLAKGGP